VRIFALAITLLAACRHPPVVEPVHDVDDDDIPDVVDRCPDVLPGCLPVDDADGCPDPGAVFVHVPLDHHDRESIAAIAQSAGSLPAGTDLMVVGYALPNEVPGLALARATAVAQRLEEDGVPLAHLLARATGTAKPGDAAPGAAVEINTTTCPTQTTGSSASR
jgi:hypothetical protein